MSKPLSRANYALTFEGKFWDTVADCLKGDPLPYHDDPDEALQRAGRVTAIRFGVARTRAICAVTRLAPPEIDHRIRLPSRPLAFGKARRPATPPEIMNVIKGAETWVNETS